VDYINRYDDINGRPVVCSIYPLESIEEDLGAFIKFEDLSNLKEIIEERDSILKKLYEIEDGVQDPFNRLLGESDKIKEVKRYSKKAALTSSNILILGESGTGKSLLASMIHNYSSRCKNKFVEINCGALTESLLESELFGYVAGAFTGAKKEGKKGLIEYAEGGTLFLDELSEMPLNIQVKLLHVIQNRRFIPVGGTEQISVDVRIICASNRDLKKMIEEGSFREDLFYRINVVPIMLPPIRERKEDLHYLIPIIIQNLCRRGGHRYRILSNEAFNKLYSYGFPGNVRELENILERGLNLSEGEYITEEDILIGAQRLENVKPLNQILEETERKTIVNYMKKFDGDKLKVMEALEIKKTSFYDKLKKYNIK
jgi:transcriptional regulator with PAS, ATPase and Fis domain